MNIWSQPKSHWTLVASRPNAFSSTARFGVLGRDLGRREKGSGTEQSTCKYAGLFVRVCVCVCVVNTHYNNNDYGRRWVYGRLPSCAIYFSYFKSSLPGGFPSSPLVKNSALQLQGSRVRSLVSELRFPHAHMPHNVTKNKKHFTLKMKTISI